MAQTVLDRPKTASSPSLGFRPPGGPTAPTGGGGGGGGGDDGQGAPLPPLSEFNDAPRLSDEAAKAEIEKRKQIQNGYKVLQAHEMCRVERLKWQQAQEKVKQQQHKLTLEQKKTEAAKILIKVGDEAIKQSKAKVEAAEHKTRAEEAKAQKAAAMADAIQAQVEQAVNKAQEERERAGLTMTALRATAFENRLQAGHQAQMQGLRESAYRPITLDVPYRRVA